MNNKPFAGSSGFVWRFDTYSPGGVLVSSRKKLNRIPAEGRDYIAGVAFDGLAQIDQWYCGLYEGDYSPEEDDTAANIAARATECVAYVGTTRPLIDFRSAAGGVSNEHAKIEVMFPVDKTIYGGFISSSPVRGGTNGVLASVVRDGPETIRAGGKLTITAELKLFTV